MFVDRLDRSAKQLIHTVIEIGSHTDSSNAKCLQCRKHRQTGHSHNIDGKGCGVYYFSNITFIGYAWNK